MRIYKLNITPFFLLSGKGTVNLLVYGIYLTRTYSYGMKIRSVKILLTKIFVNNTLKALLLHQ
ncbi:hypothetical protein CJ739_2596 [Mariniflexile rhizosphaerae]|nr:hypothetical protein CJ739_2596 [Mariniflexile sp. TRM1-10]